jgi:hypothetical protein
MTVKPFREEEVIIGPQIDEILQESADAISCMYRCALGLSISQSRALELSERFLKLLYDANETRRLSGLQHTSLERC